jgi:hypothetical protein
MEKLLILGNEIILDENLFGFDAAALWVKAH